MKTIKKKVLARAPGVVLLTLVALLPSFLLAANLPTVENSVVNDIHAISSNADPVVTVERFHSLLLSSMKRDGYAQRLAMMTGTVSEFFRPDTIARISLGRHWRGLSAEQKSSFTGLIGKLISTTYASRFDRYNGQRFNTVAIEELGKNRVRVRTTLTTSQETVSLEYQLQQQDDVWKIYDIVANGVSDLSLKRSSYSALFDKGGLEAVETGIRNSILEQETGSQ